MYFVYKHVNKFNDKVYIGITSRNPNERWGKNGCNYTSSPHFYSAITKYGWDNFEHIILYDNLTKEEACQKEKELIELYHANDRLYGYNQTSGGEMFRFSQEAKDKISNALKGNKNGFGKPCSREKAQKISVAQKGRHLTDAHKKKLSKAAHNRHVSCSEEKKKKLSQNYPHKKPVYCEELDIVFDSVRQCAKQLGLHATLVSKVCKHKLHATGGYHLHYYV